jgi:hypothetical protein
LMFWPATVMNVALVPASTSARSKASSGTRTLKSELIESAPFS